MFYLMYMHIDIYRQTFIIKGKAHRTQIKNVKKMKQSCRSQIMTVSS